MARVVKNYKIVKRYDKNNTKFSIKNLENNVNIIWNLGILKKNS